MLSAAWDGDAIELARLLRNGANIEERDDVGLSPLHLAAMDGREAAVRVLLRNNADTTAREDEHGLSPLHLAALRGHVGVVRLLLEYNADTAATGDDGNSPLHEAVQHGHEGVVRLLVENNADTAATNWDGFSPLHYWVEREGQEDMVRLLTAARANGGIGISLEPARERERRVAAEAELATERERRMAAEAERTRAQQLLDGVLQAQQRSIASITIAELREATGGFSDANIIGQGGFGPVFRTHQPLPSLPHSGPCAVKKLRQGSEQGLREVLSEIRVLSVCWHEHLLPLVGFCLHVDAPCLVYPLMVGDLQSRLVVPSQGFSWQERVSAIRDATRALVYLHTPLAPKGVVLHRDVKPSNILLDTQGNAKLADVGLAREAPELQGSVTHLDTRRLIGTPGFIDPLYQQTGQISRFTDGFAMGVSLLMCLGGRPAIARDRRDLAHVDGAATFLDSTVQWPPDVAVQALEIVRGLMLGEQPAQRMELSEALRRLEHMANSQGLHPGIEIGEVAGRSDCIICMAAPRSVRFNCGHALCCTVNGCAEAILRQGRCPTCRRQIDAFADQGDHIASQHTFVALN